MGKNIYKGGNIYIYIGKINLTFRHANFSLYLRKHTSSLLFVGKKLVILQLMNYICVY
jgi:hypothetical protein